MKTIIKSVGTVNGAGAGIELTEKASLGGSLKTKQWWVSWDTIGRALFGEQYTDATSVKDLQAERRPSVNSETGLTEAEQKCLNSLTAAFNEFTSLEMQHPDEKTDFKNGVHRLQEILAMRIARREYPDGWPTYTIKPNRS